MNRSHTRAMRQLSRQGRIQWQNSWSHSIWTWLISWANIHHFPNHWSLWGGYLLEISIHNKKGWMVAIYVCFDCEFLGISESFLTRLSPMSNRMHDTLITQTREDAREHLLCLAIFLLGHFVPDLMCISFKLNEKVPNCLLNITQSRY